jgi:hypothetical protein
MAPPPATATGRKRSVGTIVAAATMDRAGSVLSIHVSSVYVSSVHVLGFVVIQ